MENNQEENTNNIPNESFDENDIQSELSDETLNENLPENNQTQSIEEVSKENLEEDIERIEENTVSYDADDSTSDIETLSENIPEQTSEDLSVAENTDFVSVEDKNKKEDLNELVTVRPVKFQEFEPVPPNRSIKKNYDIMQDITMHVSVELGRTKFSIKEVIDLKEGSIVELDKIAGEQVEVYVNDKLVAKGEVIVIEDRFGVRVTNTSLQKANPNL